MSWRDLVEEFIWLICLVILFIVYSYILQVVGVV